MICAYSDIKAEALSLCWQESHSRLPKLFALVSCFIQTSGYLSIDLNVQSINLYYNGNKALPAAIMTHPNILIAETRSPKNDTASNVVTR